MLLDFVKTTAKDFDPGMVAVTKKGSAVTDKGEKVTEYELKLDDAAAKKLLHAFINDVILQEDTIEFGKKYMEAAINMYDFRKRKNKRHWTKSTKVWMNLHPSFLHTGTVLHKFLSR